MSSNACVVHVVPCSVTRMVLLSDSLGPLDSTHSFILTSDVCNLFLGIALRA
jgi:hypothetical protein